MQSAIAGRIFVNNITLDLGPFFLTSHGCKDGKFRVGKVRFAYSLIRF